MNNITNCKNCGAVMQYSKQYYGKMYKCEYCGTEHHIDLLGRIEDYKVKFMWQGNIIEAYLSSCGCNYETIEYCYIGDNNYSTIMQPSPTLNFEFIGHIIEEVNYE